MNENSNTQAAQQHNDPTQGITWRKYTPVTRDMSADSSTLVATPDGLLPVTKGLERMLFEGGADSTSRASSSGNNMSFGAMITQTLIIGGVTTGVVFLGHFVAGRGKKSKGVASVASQGTSPTSTKTAESTQGNAVTPASGAGGWLSAGEEEDSE